MKRTTLFIGLIVIVVVVFTVSKIIDRHAQKNEKIGGQRDEYGCLVSAGYSYDESIGACTRSWELGSEDKKRAAKIAVEAAAEDGVNDVAYTVVDVSKKESEGSFSVSLERSQVTTIVDIENWEYVSVRPKSIAGVSSEHPSMESKAINIKHPLAWSFVDSPIKVEGEARGYWFFEGDFPVILNDANGNFLATGIAKAQGEWMTENFVPFELELKFKRPENEPRYGVLIFHRDNPSGLSEHDEELDVPVYFK